MTPLAIVLALLFEHLRRLPAGGTLDTPASRFAAALAERYNDGRARSGRLVWLGVVGGAVVVTLTIHALLLSLDPMAAFGFNVLVLCGTLGAHRESRIFREIHVALRLGELARARQMLGVWRGASVPRASEAEVVRLAIEHALISAHRNIFASVFWFTLLPGPTGAVMYRLAAVFDSTWGARQDSDFGRFGVFARQAFQMVDWAPIRLTAATFSVVGNFEDAVLCWRTQARQWMEYSSGILLASGGGALGVRLGLPIHEHGRSIERPALGCGEEARVEFMQGTVGLIWRALCLCLLVLALMAIAG